MFSLLLRSNHKEGLGYPRGPRERGQRLQGNYRAPHAPANDNLSEDEIARVLGGERC